MPARSVSRGSPKVPPEMPSMPTVVIPDECGQIFASIWGGVSGLGNRQCPSKRCRPAQHSTAQRLTKTICSSLHLVIDHPGHARLIPSRQRPARPAHITPQPDSPSRTPVRSPSAVCVLPVPQDAGQNAPHAVPLVEMTTTCKISSRETRLVL